MNYGKRINTLCDRLHHAMQRFEEMRREPQPTLSAWLMLSHYVKMIWGMLVAGPFKEITAWGREKKERFGFRLAGLHNLSMSKKYASSNVTLWLGAMFRYRTIETGRDKCGKLRTTRIVTPVSAAEAVETESVTPEEAFDILVRLREAERHLIFCDQIYRMFDWIKSRSNDEVNGELYWAILVSLTTMIRALYPEHLDAVEYMKSKDFDFKEDWNMLANIRNYRVGHINYKKNVGIATLDEWWELLGRILSQREDESSVVGVATLMAHKWHQVYADELREWDSNCPDTLIGLGCSDG